MALRYRTKVDLGVAAVTVMVGAFFVYLASSISANDDGGVGPEVVPYFLAAGIIGLGILIGVSAMLFNARGAKRTLTPEELAAQEAEDQFGFRDSDLGRVAAVIFMGGVYIFLFHAVGYFLATLITLALMLVVFGNRKIVTIALLAVVGALIYHYVFMGLMGLHDPAGAYFDFQQAIGWEELAKRLPF